MPRFCLLLGGGFAVDARSGCSIRDLLCSELGVPADYLEGRIQTIFLNGRVVDDPAVATVPAGSTIALSAAMPGVAGAMLRRGSPYAAMRRTISHPHRDADRAADCRGPVVIKLFNMVRDELGPALLGRGIQIPGKALNRLFRGRSSAFLARILAARIDEALVSPDRLLETDWGDQQLLLQVSSSP